jgi:choline/glycine/proline betaine transport protein
VLFAPAGFSFIWFTIFGDTAIWLDLNVADGAISRTVAENMPIALFTVFDYLPMATLLSWITGLLVAVYFITASDAGALVIAMITSRGEEEPALWLRVGWALTCGAVAACLLLAGGLAAVQMAAVIAGLPLAVLMLAICYGIWKALSDERAISAAQRLPAPFLAHGGGNVPWRRRLAAMVSHPGGAQVVEYIRTIAADALRTLARELSDTGLQAQVSPLEDGVELQVEHGDGAPAFTYAIRPVSRPIPPFALTDAASRSERRHYARAEVFLSQGGRGYDIYGYDRDQVIADVLVHYNRFRHYLHTAAGP